MLIKIPATINGSTRNFSEKLYIKSDCVQCIEYNSTTKRTRFSILIEKTIMDIIYDGDVADYLYNLVEDANKPTEVERSYPVTITYPEYPARSPIAPNCPSCPSTFPCPMYPTYPDTQKIPMYPYYTNPPVLTCEVNCTTKIDGATLS